MVSVPFARVIRALGKAKFACKIRLEVGDTGFGGPTDACGLD